MNTDNGHESKFQMSKFKIQMTNDGVRTTSTDMNLTDTRINVKCQSSKGEIPGKPGKRALSAKLYSVAVLRCCSQTRNKS